MKNNLTDEENLVLIATSIQQTKKNLYEQRFYYLFWSWLVLATSLIHILLSYYKPIEKTYLVWPVMMGLDFLITLRYGYKSSRKTGRVESLLNRSLKHLWITLGISFFISSWIVSYAYQTNPLPIIVLLTGIGTIVSGLQMRFKALLWGGICFWIASVVSIYASPLQSLLIFVLLLATLSQDICLKKSRHENP